MICQNCGSEIEQTETSRWIDVGIRSSWIHSGSRSTFCSEPLVAVPARGRTDQAFVKRVKG